MTRAEIPLWERRLVVVAGKGGVGRTTVSAAFALHAAAQGKKVLLCQVNARERLSQLLGGPAVGEQIVRVRDRLFAVNMTPNAAIHEYGVMILKYERVYRAVLENRMAKAFLRAIPGLEDYSMLGKAWFHTTELEGGRPKWDVVVVDLQATGHSITMLRLPRSILEAVPEGPLVRDARAAADLLEDPKRTGMLLVTLAEEMPAEEAIELAAAARSRVGIDVSRVVVNQLWPSRFEAGSPKVALDALTASPPEDAALATVFERAQVSARRYALSREYVGRLRERIAAPQVQLPFLFSRRFGKDEVEHLSAEIARQL